MGNTPQTARRSTFKVPVTAGQREDMAMGHGKRIIRLYCDMTGLPEGENETALADLLADLRHWAVNYGVSYTRADGQAERHYDEEQAESEAEYQAMCEAENEAMYETDEDEEAENDA